MLLIDGDVIKYKACLAAQYNYYTVEYNIPDRDYILHLGAGQKIRGLKDRFKNFTDLNISATPQPKSLEFAKYCAERLLADVLMRFSTHPYKLYLNKLGGKPNYRMKLATIKPYKGNRKDKPIFYEQLSKEMETWDNVELVEGRESDDAMGCEQYYSLHAAKAATIICSIDKDMKMIPGHHYNLDTKIMTYITLDQADYNFYKQLLLGDEACDNIPHLLKGIGPKKAEKILKPCKNNYERWMACFNEYSKLMYKSEIFEIANLLWIQREKDKLFVSPKREDYEKT